MDTEGVEVWAGLSAVVQLLDLEVAAADKVVVGDHDTGDGAEEDTVGGEIGGKLIVVGEQVPGAHGETDGGANVASAADVDEAGEQGGHVGAGRHGVGGDVGAELGESKGGSDYEDAKSLAGAAVVDELVEDVERVPDGLVVDDGGGGGDDDADKGGEREANGDGEELRPQGVAGLAGESSKVGIVDNEGGKVGNGGHDALDHLPGQVGAVDGVGLLGDGADAAGADDGPDEEGDAGDGHNVGLDGEEVADLVDGEPDGGQGAEPEEEEGDKVGGAGVGRAERVWDLLPVP